MLAASTTGRMAGMCNTCIPACTAWLLVLGLHEDALHGMLMHSTL
jgi:hypothetical protein